jgi:hypothetical protein
LAVAVSAFFISHAVAEAPPPGANPRSREAAAFLTERAERSFRKGYFYKPRDNGMQGDEITTFAPLIVAEAADAGQAAAEPFGALAADEALKLDATRPTVYAATSAMRVGGPEYSQVTFVWRYGCAEKADCVSHSGRGVRMTLGPDGTPLLWEALSTDEARRLLFVSKSVENAAAREFGAPLPGRRFSIERGIDETPDVVVVRGLEDGPVPMGPYVYVSAAPARDITTVLCRCMPSQVDEFAATYSYDLAPLESIEARFARPQGGAASVRWDATLRWEELMTPERRPPLDALLRWPSKLE